MAHEQLDPELVSRRAHRFADRVRQEGAPPPACLDDLRKSCELAVSGEPPLLRLTCTITGGSYERPWDGAETTAFALTDEGSDDTAYLVTETRHYAWLGALSCRGTFPNAGPRDEGCP
jgi:hypothetical protein